MSSGKRISQIIAELQEIQKITGDLVVLFWDRASELHTVKIGLTVLDESDFLQEENVPPGRYCEITGVIDE
jgi:hypothetical protein